jgi:hypothetical protein
MNTKNFKKAKLILVVYLIATLSLLFLGYSVQKPRVARQEFPFSISYSYQGETKTISDVYVGEYARGAKYLGDDAVAWYGYIKDHDRLESDFYRLAEVNGKAFSINLNIEPGYLMGDPKHAVSVCQPTGVCHQFDGTNNIAVTDPAELAELGFSIVSWEYPTPIENSFSFGGISLSSEATIYTAAIAVLALLACMILIKKDKELTYGTLDKISILLNILVIVIGFPFILIVSSLSEILAEVSPIQQLLYFSPALTVIGIAASVTLRRMGHKNLGFLIQFAGPAVFALSVLIENP